MVVVVFAVPESCSFLSHACAFLVVMTTAIGCCRQINRRHLLGVVVLLGLHGVLCGVGLGYCKRKLCPTSMLVLTAVASTDLAYPVGDVIVITYVVWLRQGENSVCS